MNGFESVRRCITDYTSAGQWSEVYNGPVEDCEEYRLKEENARLRSLFCEAWEWMQRARYDRSIRTDEMDEIGVKAIKLGFPDYELGMEVDE